MLHCGIHANVMPKTGTGCRPSDFLMRDGGIFPMKILITFAMVVALGAAAQAKPAPLDPRPISLSTDDAAIATGPAGATLESNYFRAPPQPYAAGRVFPCRLQLRVFEKTRIAQSCH